MPEKIERMSFIEARGRCKAAGWPDYFEYKATHTDRQSNAHDEDGNVVTITTSDRKLSREWAVRAVEAIAASEKGETK